jgi:GTP cyclohydrolase I
MKAPAMWEIVGSRLRAAGVPFKANDPIGEHLDGPELAWLEDDVTKAFNHVLDCLLIDRENDHNTRDTPRRLAKLFMREVFAGRYQRAPNVTHFPNVKAVDEMYTLGPMAVRSTCSHHFAPIMGNVWIGVIPGDKLIGISKLSRIASWVMSRPQIQEEAVTQLADHLEQMLDPRALAVVVKASHMCMTWRGVKEHDTEMVTSVMRGTFQSRPDAKAEFMSIIRGQGYAG